MRKALILTIGTEITCGEIVNSNAAWVSERLEELGVRVFAHLTTRDHHGEVARALEFSTSDAYDLIVVTGGLGPTTDDITREVMAKFAGVPLEFDDNVWVELQAQHASRSLPMRESHKHQCYFPLGSERLPNPVGTALGFTQTIGPRLYITLPGPPRELEGIWTQEVVPRLQKNLGPIQGEWVRWTCLGAPESEIADLTESILQGHDIEVGYRAQVPYVKVKIFADRTKQRELIQQLDEGLDPFIVARGRDDLAEIVLQKWPLPELELVDHVTGSRLLSRLLAAKASLDHRQMSSPSLRFASDGHPPAPGVFVRSEGETFTSELRLPQRPMVQEARTLPFKTRLSTERGQRSSAEWILWHLVRALS